MPPPPPPPGPPPAPGPPPPPTFNQASTQPPKFKKSEAVNRNALLGSIESFKASGLRKTKHLMVDKSAPAVGGSVDKANRFNTYSGARGASSSGGRTLPGGWMNQVTHKKGPAPPCPSTGPRQFHKCMNSPKRVVNIHSNGIAGQHQVPRLESLRQNTAPEIVAKTGGAGAASGPKLGSATVGRTGANKVQPPQGLGGLFAGGMPQLKSTGNRFAAETSNNSTDSGAQRPGVGNRYLGQAHQQQSTAPSAQNSQVANMKRHQSAGDIQNIAKNFTNQGPPALPNQRPSASGGAGVAGRSAGGVKKWPPVAAGQGTTVNGRLGNHNSGSQPQSSMPPPPPPSTNRPSLNQFSRNQPSHVNAGAGSGIGNHMQVGTGHQRDRPLPEVPNLAGGATPKRGGAGGGSAGGAPPPPPPARTQQTSLRRKSSSGGASSSSSSNGMGSPRSANAAPGTMTSNSNRPLPPTPCQPPSSCRAPPPPPARNPARPLPSPAPVRHPQQNTNYRPSRPPGGAPPPPPPAREPNQGGPPPPPPPRAGPGQIHGSSVGYNRDFESQFRFMDINMLPPPEPFTNMTKTYPSKSPKNLAAKANGNARRYPPAH